MKWVTRERPKIDRIACPWLIARFIDEQPEFLYVPSDQVRKVAAETGAIPYDVRDVELCRVREVCSFDAFLRKYGLDEPELRNSRRSSAAPIPRDPISPRELRFAATQNKEPNSGKEMADRTCLSQAG
jgi:hypothetical protein